MILPGTKTSFRKVGDSDTPNELRIDDDSFGVVPSLFVGCSDL